MKSAEYAQKLTEAQLQEKVVALARARGWKIHHDRRQDLSIAGDVGFPDLVLARYGDIILAELKSETGRLTRQQEEWLDHLGMDEYSDRVLVAVWRPRDWPEIEEILA